MIPFYTVNLARDSSKKLYMRSMAEEFGLTLEFIDAVAGTDLTDQELNSFYDASKAIIAIGRVMSLSEVGCALSHRKIYRHMIDHKIPIAVVFEDDIDLIDNFNEVLSELLDYPSDWGLLLLGSHIANSHSTDVKTNVWKRQKVSKNYTVAIPAEMAFGTYGYIVTLEAAKSLLELTAVIDKPIDNFTGNYNISGAHVISPSIVKTNDALSLNSSIAAERSEKRASKKESETVRLRKQVVQILGLYGVYKYCRTRLRVLINQVRLL